MSGAVPLPVRAWSCAVDFGVSFDHSALALLVRLAGVGHLNPDHDGRPVYLALTKVWPQGTPLAEVVEDAVGIIVRWRPRVVALEPLGVGAMPSQEIRRQASALLPRVFTRRDSTQWLTVNTTRQLKLAAFGCLLWGLERGQIVLQRDPEVLRQLAGMRLSQSARGGASLDAEVDDVHDDVADTLAFAMLPRPTPRGVRCAFSKLAEEKFAGPTLAVPGYSGDIVETGAGLRLYAKPPLQCVTSGVVAAPPFEGIAPLASSAPPDSPQVREARAAIAAARGEGDDDA